MYVCCYGIFTDYCFGGYHIIKYMYMGSWTIPHGEVTLVELVTGNRTLNQTAALEQCWAALGDGHFVLFTGNHWLLPELPVHVRVRTCVLHTHITKSHDNDILLSLGWWGRHSRWRYTQLHQYYRSQQQSHPKWSTIKGELEGIHMYTYVCTVKTTGYTVAELVISCFWWSRFICKDSIRISCGSDPKTAVC